MLYNVDLLNSKQQQEQQHRRYHRHCCESHFESPNDSLVFHSWQNDTLILFLSPKETMTTSFDEVKIVNGTHPVNIYTLCGSMYTIQSTGCFVHYSMCCKSSTISHVFHGRRNKTQTNHADLYALDAVLAFLFLLPFCTLFLRREGERVI